MMAGTAAVTRRCRLLALRGMRCLACGRIVGYGRRVIGNGPEAVMLRRGPMCREAVRCGGAVSRRRAIGYLVADWLRGEIEEVERIEWRRRRCQSSGFEDAQELRQASHRRVHEHVREGVADDDPSGESMNIDHLAAMTEIEHAPGHELRQHGGEKSPVQDHIQ